MLTSSIPTWIPVIQRWIGNRVGAHHLIQISELDTTELLCHLEKAYDKLADVHDYSKDLLSYLKYCKDVVYAGLTTSFEEDNFIEQLWNLYETQDRV
ncbi:hypothetical protein AAC387_Pa11g0148 [Persea americana]